MNKLEVEEMLNKVTSDRLSKILSRAGIRHCATTRDEKMELLYEVYTPKYLKRIYDERLNDYEKELIKTIVENNNTQRIEDLKKVYMKYYPNADLNRWYREKYDDKSAINVFTLCDSYNLLNIDNCVMEMLKEFIPVLTEKFEETENVEGEYTVLQREGIEDFDKIVQYININKLKVAPKKQVLNKRAYDAVVKLLDLRDIYYCKPEDVSSIEQTYICDAMFKILYESNIVSIRDGEYVLNDAYKEYINLEYEEKMKFLYEGILNSNLNEASELVDEKIAKKFKNVKLKGAREKIINKIKKFPIDKWIEYDKLVKIFRMYEPCFLREFTGEIVLSKHKYYIETISHYEFEEKYIKRFILKFLLALGLIDVQYEVKYTPYDVEYYDGYYTDIHVKYIKLNKLGAYVFGCVDKYENESSNENDKAMELFVTNDFEVVVENTKNKIKHEIYFDKYFQGKKVLDTTIYRLEFNGIVKALDDDIGVFELKEYLIKYSKNTVPQNVLDKLEYWEAISKKVTIEKTYILRCDEDILEEFENEKGFKSFIKEEVPNAIIIKEEKINKVKEYFQDKGYYLKKIGD